MNPVGRGQGTRAMEMPAGGVRRRRPQETKAHHAAMHAIPKHGVATRHHHLASSSSSSQSSSDSAEISQPKEREWRWLRRLRETAGSVYVSCIQFFQNGTFLMPRFNPSRSINDARNGLNDIAGGVERGAACHVIACYVRDYVIQNCRRPQHTNRDGVVHWTASVFRTDDDAESLTGKYLRKLVDKNSKELLDASEMTLLRAFSNLTNRINARAVTPGEIYEHDFVLNVVLQMVQLAGDHFSIINETKRQYGSEVDEGALRSAFANAYELHRGLNYPPDSNAAEIRQRAIDTFFEGASEKFLEIALPRGPGDLEAPTLAKGFLWSKLKGVVIPNVFADQVDTILDPATLDSIVLSVLNHYNDPKPKPTVSSGALAHPLNKKLRDFDKECGRLVKEVATFLAPNMSKLFFLWPHLQEKIGEAVGSSIYDIVTNRNFINKAINSGLDAGLPSFHPGRWERDDNKKVFRPLKKVTMPGDREGLQPAEECSFSFAINKSEQDAECEQHEQDKDEIRAKLVETLDATFNKQIKSLLPDMWCKMCCRVSGVIDPIIEGVAGEKGLLVRERICTVLDFAVRVVIGKVLAIAFFPVTHVVRVVVDHYTWSKAEEVVKRLHMDIHRNLLYNYLDVVVSALQVKGDKAHRHPI